MPSEEKPGKLWLPPEQIPTNVGKMAWPMFLKWWEWYSTTMGFNESLDEKDLVENATEVYRKAILVATALEKINAGGDTVNPLQEEA